MDHFATAGVGALSSAHRKYDGAVAVGSSLIMAPMDADGIGILDAATYNYSSVPIGVTGSRKYSGAVAVGGKVYMAPFKAMGVGVYDSASGAFHSIPVSGGSNYYKYSGVARSPATGLLYFGPYDMSDVGVLNASDDTWSTIALPGQTGRAYSQYSGIVAVGRYLYCVPYDASSVLVIDALTEQLHSISLPIALAAGAGKFYGGVAVGGGGGDAARVYLVPYHQGSVGVVDTTTWTISALDIPTAGLAKYARAAVLDDAIYFCPFYADAVGVLDTRSGQFRQVRAAREHTVRTCPPAATARATHVDLPRMLAAAAASAHAGRCPRSEPSPRSPSALVAAGADRSGGWRGHPKVLWRRRRGLHRLLRASGPRRRRAARAFAAALALAAAAPQAAAAIAEPARAADAAAAASERAAAC